MIKKKSLCVLCVSIYIYLYTYLYIYIYIDSYDVITCFGYLKPILDGFSVLVFAPRSWEMDSSLCKCISIEQWKNPGHVPVLPSYIGIRINHYKDPYQSTSIMESLKRKRPLINWFLACQMWLLCGNAGLTTPKCLLTIADYYLTIYYPSSILNFQLGKLW